MLLERYRSALKDNDFASSQCRAIKLRQKLEREIMFLENYLWIFLGEILDKTGIQ